MKQTCIIVEDEKMSRLKLEGFINKTQYLDLKGSFEDPLAAITFLRSHHVDVIFLDVEMPEITGFELLDTLQVNPKIILTTAHKEYAYQGFQYDITAFLLKPFTLPSFIAITEKLNQENQPTDSKPNKGELFIKVDGELIKLTVSEIVYIEAYGDFVKIYTQEKRYIPRTKMSHIEAKLPSKDFTRFHRSYIINHLHLSKIEDNCAIVGEKVLPIASNKLGALTTKLNIL